MKNLEKQIAELKNKAKETDELANKYEIRPIETTAHLALKIIESLQADKLQLLKELKYQINRVVDKGVENQELRSKLARLKSCEKIPQSPASQPSIPVKEERLPEVGKSYFNLKEEMDFEVIKIEKGKIETRPKTTYLYRADQFWKYFEEIPNNSQKPQIIDELHISGRGLCFVVKKDKEWKIGDTIKKDDKEYIVTGIDSGRESLGLIVRENSQKLFKVEDK